MSLFKMIPKLSSVFEAQVAAMCLRGDVLLSELLQAHMTVLLTVSSVSVGRQYMLNKMSVTNTPGAGDEMS